MISSLLWSQLRQEVFEFEADLELQKYSPKSSVSHAMTKEPRIDQRCKKKEEGKQTAGATEK